MDKNILVVDDDVSVLKGFERILKEKGYTVDVAADVKGALDFFGRRHYQIAVIDVVLKEGSGLELVNKIKKISEDTAVIMITGYPSSEYAAGSFRQGAFEYLEKPLTRDVLLDAIQRGLENRELDQKNEKLAGLCQEDPNPILRIARDGHILYANRAAFSLAECLVKPGEKSLLEHWQQFVQKACDNGVPTQTESECSGRICSLTFVPVPDTDYVNVYGVDITDLKPAKKKSENTPAIIELLTKIAELGNATTNGNQAMQEVLKFVCDFMGWPVGHVYVKKQNKMVPSDIWQIEAVKEFIAFRRATGQTSFSSGEGMIGRVIATGRPVWIKDVTEDPGYLRTKLARDIGVKAALAFPVFIGKEVAAVLEFHTEEAREPDEAVIDIMANVGVQLGRILERKHACVALTETEDIFRNVCSLSYDAIVMMDEEGDTAYWNEAAERIFGYTAEEVIGKDMHGLIAPERYREDAKKGILRFKETGQGAMIAQSRELMALRKDGTEFPVEISVSAVKMNGRWHAIGTIKDITRRKKTEETLKIQMREIKKFNEMAVGRELRMVEIKKEINQLCREMGIQERY